MEKIIKFLLRISHEFIFPKQLAFGIFFLRLFGDKKYCANLKTQIESCGAGTVGCAMNNFLNSNNLSLVPWYEQHDLKHVLTGYGISAVEEMRMQAFMFGNAGFRPMVTLMTISFLIWTPDVWKELPYHFLIGKFTKPIRGLQIEDVIDLNLEELQQKIGLEDARSKASYIFTELFTDQMKSNELII
ncbi:MAG: hypothetical protein R2788_14965 [Saprospiraceae bacterium]